MAKEKKKKNLSELISGKEKKKSGIVLKNGSEDSRNYKETSVDDIVKRMEKKYKDRGILEEEGLELTRGDKLKEMVVGVKPIHLDRRTAEDFVESDSLALRIIGTIYTVFTPLNKVAEKIAMWNMNQNLPLDLNKANMGFSVKQYVSIAMVASFLSLGLFFLLWLLIFLLPLEPTIVDLFYDMPGPVITLMQVILSGLLTFFSGFMVLFVVLKIPIVRASKRAIEIDRELPFALRQMATEIRSGIGIHGSLRSLVKSDYGTLSDEFGRVLRDIEKGKSTEDALDEMVIRSPSESLAMAGVHMIRAIRTGGNLSDIISEIADEVAFKLRMKMKAFVSKLNLIGLFYMMIGVIAPVLLAVLASIFTAVPVLGLQGVLGPEILFLLYFVLIPMMLGMILYIVKMIQPM